MKDNVADDLEWPPKVVSGTVNGFIVYQQELSLVSYRKQIARQLRTQYVESICRSNHP